jgi:hypothetical protein
MPELNTVILAGSAVTITEDPTTKALTFTTPTLAPLASPALTGTPTAPTAAPGPNTTQVATTAFVQAAVSGVIDAAPGALDTLNELAAALGDDASFASTVTTALAAKAPLASPAFTGTPTAPTPTAADNSTKVATTAYVDAAVAAGGGAITAKDEGTNLTTAVSSLDFVGAGVTATNVGGAVTVTIPGGGGGGGTLSIWDPAAIPTDSAVDATRSQRFTSALNLTDWTWHNQSTATQSVERNRLLLSTPSAAGPALRHLTRDLPAAPWCIMTRCVVEGATTYVSVGLTVKNTTTGKIFRHTIQTRAAPVMQAYLYNTETSGAGDLYTGDHLGSRDGALAVGYDGTNFTLYVSADGFSWSTYFHTFTQAGTLGAGTLVGGVCIDPWGGGTCSGSFENFIVLTQATPIGMGKLVTITTP